MVNVPLLYLIVTKNFLLKRLLQNRLNLLYILNSHPIIRAIQYKTPSPRTEHTTRKNIDIADIFTSTPF